MAKADHQESSNYYTNNVHRMQSGRVVEGVSHSWARAVDNALTGVLDASPNLHHIAIKVPKADLDVLRLFHTHNGEVWKQVNLPEIARDRRLNIQAIVRGAQELDGDPAFSQDLSLLNLRLREQAGYIVRPKRQRLVRSLRATDAFTSISDWVEHTALILLNAGADLYVTGAQSDEAREGRKKSLISIERLIGSLCANLTNEDNFAAELQPNSYDAQINNALKDHFIRKSYPFITSTHIFHYHLPNLTKEKRKIAAKALWADAAGLPRNSRFNHIYGALLRSAEGHPIFGDHDYKRLEAILAEALNDGFSVVRLNGFIYSYTKKRWRPMREDRITNGQTSWTKGVIISRNHGRLIVPPHLRDGVLVPGYTRNGSGEGPSQSRKPPVTMNCAERPVSDTDLAWLHSYHSWGLSQR